MHNDIAKMLRWHKISGVWDSAPKVLTVIAMEQSNEDLQKFITSLDDDLAVLQASQSNESQLYWKE